MNTEQQKKILGIGIFAAILVVLAGLIYFGVRSEQGVALEVLLQHVPYEVRVTATPPSPALGEAATVQFAVTLDGQPIDLAADTIYPHAYVVSSNLQDTWFYHIDSLEQVQTGVYEFSHTFTQPAPYTVWLEFNDNKTADHHGARFDYIARFSIEPKDIVSAPLPASASSVTSAQNYLPDISYQLRLLPYELKAGQPGTVTAVAETGTGEQAALLPQFDHFFAVASPESNFYILDHPQPSEKGDTEAVMGPFTFPQPGKYAIWMRLFPDDGTGEVTDAVEGVLIVEVAE